MTYQLNIADAKARLSELIDRMEQGEEVVIAKAGKPVAKLVPITTGISRSHFFGALAHLGPVPDDAWLPEPSDALYGFEDEHPSYLIAAEREHTMNHPAPKKPRG